MYQTPTDARHSNRGKVPEMNSSVYGTLVLWR